MWDQKICEKNRIIGEGHCAKTRRIKRKYRALCERGIDIEDCEEFMRKTRLLREGQRNHGKEQRIVGRHSIMEETGFMKKDRIVGESRNGGREGLWET